MITVTVTITEGGQGSVNPGCGVSAQYSIEGLSVKEEFEFTKKHVAKLGEQVAEEFYFGNGSGAGL